MRLRSSRRRRALLDREASRRSRREPGRRAGASRAPAARRARAPRAASSRAAAARTGSVTSIGFAIRPSAEEQRTSQVASRAAAPRVADVGQRCASRPKARAQDVLALRRPRPPTRRAAGAARRARPRARSATTRSGRRTEQREEQHAVQRVEQRRSSRGARPAFGPKSSHVEHVREPGERVPVAGVVRRRRPRRQPSSVRPAAAPFGLLRDVRRRRRSSRSRSRASGRRPPARPSPRASADRELASHRSPAPAAGICARRRSSASSSTVSSAGQSSVFRDVERREEADHAAGGDVHEHAALRGAQRQRCRALGVAQREAEQESAAARLLGRLRVLAREALRGARARARRAWPRARRASPPRSDAARRSRPRRRAGCRRRWCRGRRARRSRRRPRCVRKAPIGKPPPSPLPSVTTSGTTPSCSSANMRPVRPTPVCTSSKISSAPAARVRRRSAAR